MTRNRIIPLALVLGLLLAFVVGCGGEAAPEPTEFTSPLPPPGPTPLGGPAFALAEPLTDGATQVSGQGPADLTIVIADVTLMGEILGRGQIDADGNFQIDVRPALIVNHRIGIMLDAEATEIEYTEELFARLETLLGDAAITIPRVGRIYDAASVQP